MSVDDEAAQAYNMLNEDDEADEWNQEFREVEKAAGNPGRVRSGASPSTSVVEALEWEQSSEQSTEEDEEEQEEEEQDGAEEETEEESRDKEENATEQGGRVWWNTLST